MRLMGDGDEATETASGPQTRNDWNLDGNGVIILTDVVIRTVALDCGQCFSQQIVRHKPEEAEALLKPNRGVSGRS